MSLSEKSEFGREIIITMQWPRRIFGISITWILYLLEISMEMAVHTPAV